MGNDEGAIEMSIHTHVHIYMHMCVVYIWRNVVLLQGTGIMPEYGHRRASCIPGCW